MKSIKKLKLLKLTLVLINVLFAINVTNSFSDTTTGLVAHYPFDGNSNDLQYNNNGSEFGGISYVNGIKNLAVHFDGIDDFIKINENNNLSFNSNPFSIFFWVKTVSGGIIMDERITNNTGYTILFSDTWFKFDLSEKNRVYSPDNINLYDNNWHFIGFVRNETELLLYFDGLMVGSAENTFIDIGDSHPIYIARRYTIPDIDAYPYFKGAIDELRIYNRSLSQKDIDDLYSISIDNKIIGKIITSSEILGYTANVGGATVNATPYNLSSVTDIYGEFQIADIPVGECILQIESSYFQTFTKTIQVNTGENIIDKIEIFKPKCHNMYTQQEVDQLLHQVQSENDAIITEKETTIEQLNTSIASMYTQGYLDKAIVEAEKRGELKYDINNDGKVGLEEIIKYLETISGVRVESLIIFPEEKKHYLSE